MGRKRIRPLGYQQITEQAEKTITLLMRAAHIKTNSALSREQSVSRAVGAFVLWDDLTASHADKDSDRKRLLDLLVSN